ncbi:hypothetical protein ACCO45_000467 [Purpureocillium lilacinum]
MLYTSHYSTHGGEWREFGFVPATRANWNVTLPIYATSLNTSITNDACKPLPDSTPNLGNKIVLIRMGTCLPYLQARYAGQKGANHIMFYNDVPGASTVSVADRPLPHVRIVSAGMVEPETGEAWVKALKAGSVITTYPDIRGGGAVSPFSSFGPTFGMDFKPQFGAPGGNILSTHSIAKGTIEVMSGTSQATPLMAAIIALIFEVRGKLDPRSLTNLLAAHAVPQLRNDGFRFFKGLAPAPHQGAGLVQAYNTAYATNMLEPSSLSFNDSDHLQPQLTFTLSNYGKLDVSYRISHVPASTVYVFPRRDDPVWHLPMSLRWDFVDAAATLGFSEEQVALAPGRRKTVSVSAKQPTNVDLERCALWSGYIIVNGRDGSSLSLPYQGLAGSPHNKTIVRSDKVILSDSDIFDQPRPPKSTFTLPAPGRFNVTDVLPLGFTNLGLGSRIIRVDIVPLTTCPPKGLAIDDPIGCSNMKTIGQPDMFLGEAQYYKS